ncbi:hypothetical protein [Methanoculleus sp.]|jgi:hypothetical protein|uniref:hypothetical protein n=1 Tax=Methanoculleus sp. TaxID=90427 RepID=UPI0025DE0BD3|nr:hypothetical protein [Methanoculleus sp.]MCK9320236.1 hypothetical protein [Methanoculleus sp.]
MKFNQEQISKLKEIKKDLIEIKEKKSAIKNFEDFIKKGKLPELLVSIVEKIAKTPGIKGDKGDTPTDEELVALIKPLIPEPIKGEDGVDGLDGETPSEEYLLELIRPLIPQVKNGETPSDERLLSLIRPLIPNVKNGVDGKDGKDGIDGDNGSPDTPKEIVNKISTLKGNDRLDASAIKNIPATREIQPMYSMFGGRGSVKEVTAGSNIIVQKNDSGNSTVSLKDTLTSAVKAAPHGTSSLPQLVNVCYGTGNPPDVDSVPEGTIYIRYTA